MYDNIDLSQYDHISTYNFGSGLTGWAVIGIKNYRDTILIRDLPNEEVADAWIRHLADKVVKKQIAQAQSYPV